MGFINFIPRYFTSKNVVYLTAFLCWSDGEISQLYRRATDLNLRVVTKNNFSRDLLRFDPEGLTHREGMLLDMDCPNADMVIDQASKARVLNQRHVWYLHQNDEYNRSKLVTDLADAPIFPDSEVLWAASNKMVDLYRTKIKEPLIITELDLSLNSTLEELTSYWQQQPSGVRRRKDLRNITIPAVVVIGQPQLFKSFEDTTNRHIDSMAKVSYPLMMLMAQDLNYRYNFRQVDKYGYKNSNGTWDGAMELIKENKIEMIASHLLIKKDRMEHVHYVADSIEFRLSFIFRQPSQSAVSNIFLLPLSHGVWIALFVVFVCVTILLVVFNKLLKYINPGLKVIGVGETITFTFGSLCQQGYYSEVNVQSVRILMICTHFLALFVFTSYSAKIVAILQAPSNAIQTIDDLAKSPLTCGVQLNNFNRPLYHEVVAPDIKNLYTVKLKPFGDRAFSYSVEEGVAKLRKEPFAFHVELTAGADMISKTFTETEKCGLNYIDPMRLKALGIPIKRNSGYKELMATRFRWQREIGMFDRSERYWYVRKPRCEYASGGFVSVGIVDCWPAMQVLVYGILLSVAILCTEIMIHKIQRDCTLPKKISFVN